MRGENQKIKELEELMLELENKGKKQPKRAKRLEP